MVLSRVFVDGAWSNLPQLTGGGVSVFVHARFEFDLRHEAMRVRVEAVLAAYSHNARVVTTLSANNRNTEDNEMGYRHSSKQDSRMKGFTSCHVRYDRLHHDLALHSRNRSNGAFLICSVGRARGLSTDIGGHGGAWSSLVSDECLVENNLV
uniref:Uncharacterized protein n=1 Tax=Timema bartmani TaxID=61472 RepID=A0A7R9I4Y0_9NEOP|nr:unnamed protein product [Timema bartmani]